MTIKKDHLLVLTLPYTRDYLKYIEEVSIRLSSACGNEDVDWFVEEYHQHSEINFTVIKEKKELAILAIKNETKKEKTDPYQKTLDEF